MSLKQLKHQIQNEISQHKFSIFIQLKIEKFLSMNYSQMIQQALEIMKKSKNLEIVCFISYQEKIDNMLQTFSRYDTAHSIQRLLISKKKEGIKLDGLKVQFLAIYDKQAFTLENIIQKITHYNKVRFQNQPQIDRNLNLIDKGQKKTIQAKSKQETIKQSKNQKIDKTKSKQFIEEKPTAKTQKPLKKITHSKQQHAQKQIDHKKSIKSQNIVQKQKIKINQSKNQNQNQNRKLQIQSSESQSQDIYDPRKNDVHQLFRKNVNINEKMQIQNQQNKKQNKNMNINDTIKMQIQQNEQKNKKIHKTAIQQQEDSDGQDIFDQFAKMQNKRDNKKVSQFQLSKSQPLQVIKKPSGGFKNTFQNQAPKKTGTKQVTLFGYMKKQ